jgi:DNA-binding transcriptional ArsR family regulator
VLRIHFTAMDLASVRISAQPDPLWELALSMHHLRLKATPTTLSSWKEGVASRLRPDGKMRVEVALLLAINPPVGYFPDFLTPSASGSGFEAGVEAILATPMHRLRTEIALVGQSATRRAAAAMAGLGRGDLAALRDLERGLRRYREIALEHHWDRITSAFAADRILRSRHMADDGLGTFLSQLHPTAQFRDGILHIGSWGVGADRDLHLDGRGITVVPCYFKETRQLMVLADDDLPPVLVYPIDHDMRMLAEARLAPLSELLGPTRARVLEWASELTSSEIAGRLGVATPVVSKHITVLRNAGLIVSVRYRNHVIHTWTPLGRGLLDGAAPGPLTQPPGQ